MRRRYRRYRRDAGKTLRQSLCVLLITVLLASCVTGYLDLLDLVALYGENRCRNLVTQLAMDAAAAGLSTEKLYDFTDTENTEVIALNSAAVRQFQAVVGNTLSQGLDALEEQAYPVPIGTVIGGVLLMGRGPMIEIRYIPVGSTQVQVTSRLQQAGVNQVLYQVVLEVQIDMTVVLPAGTKQINCDQAVVLEEVLITGQVPYVYSG